MEEPKVLFIIGKGRSGSTVLDNALNEIDGVFSAGELVRTWRRQPLDEYVCGCGAKLGACPLWEPVIRSAYEQVSRELDRPVSTRDALTWEEQVLRWRLVPRMLRQRPGGPSQWKELDRLTRSLAALYRSLAATTGARVLVDSSKWPAHPGALGLVPGIQPYVLHLVRDPRAVAFSWQREKAYPVYGESMPRFAPTHSALSWAARNLLAQRVRLGSHAPGMLLRYEDFVDDPARVLKDIVHFLSEGATKLPLTGSRTLLLGPNHTAMGNPSRFTTGRVELSLDDEWKRGLGRFDSALVTTLTWPLLRRYGYPVRPGGR